MSNIWKDVDLIGFVNKINFTDDTSKYITKTFNTNDLSKDMALYMSSSSYYNCVKSTTCTDSYESLGALDADLNNAPASLPGVLVRFKKSNQFYYYLCSRNNNFSNRSQKGSINVL